MDKKLAMGAYVKATKDGTTEYSYMQDGIPSTGENIALFPIMKN